MRAGAAAFDPDAPVRADVLASAGPGWYRLAAAAALVLVLGSAAWWQMAARRGASVAQVASPSAASTTAPTATPALPGATPAPLTLSWAALPAALTLVVRGVSAERDAFMQAFGAAITPYRQARYAAAAAALEGGSTSARRGCWPNVRAMRWIRCAEPAGPRWWATTRACEAARTGR